MKICCIKNADLTEKIPAEVEISVVDFDEIFNDINVHWIERAKAEEDVKYKQIIPYILVKNSDDKFAFYPRHGTEKRIHGLYSCGIGGHIDYIDRDEDLSQTILNGMQRELSEEFKNFEKEKISLKYLGIMNENKTKVGLVHIAIVFLAECQKGYLPKPAAELEGLQWGSFLDIKNLKKELWSTMAFDLLDKYKNIN